MIRDHIFQYCRLLYQLVTLSIVGVTLHNPFVASTKFENKPTRFGGRFDVIRRLV